MSDREVITDWIGDFLVSWRDTRISEQNAAEAIMFVLSGYPTLFA